MNCQILVIRSTISVIVQICRKLQLRLHYPILTVKSSIKYVCLDRWNFISDLNHSSTILSTDHFGGLTSATCIIDPRTGVAQVLNPIAD